MKILGYGKCIGDLLVTNDDLSKIVDTSDEWIVQRTGIQQRYLSSKGTLEMAYESAVAALENANVSKDEIDLIVVATITPDYITPSVASLVQEKLGITKPIMAFDINAACSGFVYALNVVEGLLMTGMAKALVIGSETMSRIINFQDRNTCILFGDGAGSVVVTNSDVPTKFHCCSIGNKTFLHAKAFPLNTSMNHTTLQASFLEMNGKEVFKFACDAFEKSIQNILAMNHCTLQDVACIIPHQANKRIIDFVAKRLKIPNEKIFMNLMHYGNTSAASIAVALCEAKQHLQKNDKVILVGFGAGLTYAATMIEI